MFDPRDNPTPVRGFLFGDRNQPAGYLIYFQERRKPPLEPDRLVVKDMVAASPAAAQAIWSFLYGHRSTVDHVVWSGAASDATTLTPTECKPTVLHANVWMMRILNAPAALEQRGYRTLSDVTLEMEIDDATMPENTGRITLKVSGGRGQVEPGGGGHLKIDARGLAALYSGFYNATTLRIAGRLDGTETALQAADQIFLGSHPWTPDTF